MDSHRAQSSDGLNKSTVTVTSEDVTINDVLVHNTNEELQLLFDQDLVNDAHVGNIGNNRFKVLSQIHQQNFEKLLAAGRSTDEIVQLMIDIVRDRYEGRFLLLKESSGAHNNLWTILSKEEAYNFVQSHLMGSVLSNVSTIFRPEESATRFPADGTDDDPISSRASSQASDLINDGDEDKKKRRRRSSLLRRSQSEGNTLFTGKKKTSRVVDGSERETASDDNYDNQVARATVGDFHDNQVVDSNYSGSDTKRLPFLMRVPWRKTKNTSSNTTPPKTLDVVFNNSDDALVEGHTGNNRFKIIIELRKKSYFNADAEGQEKTVQEVVETVSTHWKSRFVFKNTNDTYGTLSDDQAKRCIRALFTKCDDITEGSSKTEIELVKKPLAIKQKSLQTLNQFQPAERDKHSAAIASLQKKKQRQGLTSRIRDLTAGALGGRSSRNTLTPTTGDIHFRSTFLHRSSSAPSAAQFAMYTGSSQPAAPTSLPNLSRKNQNSVPSQQHEHSYEGLSIFNQSTSVPSAEAFDNYMDLPQTRLITQTTLPNFSSNDKNLLALQEHEDLCERLSSFDPNASDFSAADFILSQARLETQSNLANIPSNKQHSVVSQLHKPSFDGPSSFDQNQSAFSEEAFATFMDTPQTRLIPQVTLPNIPFNNQHSIVSKRSENLYKGPSSSNTAPLIAASSLLHTSEASSDRINFSSLPLAHTSPTVSQGLDHTVSDLYNQLPESPIESLLSGLDVSESEFDMQFDPPPKTKSY